MPPAADDDDDTDKSTVDVILAHCPWDVASLSSFESANERLHWAANCKVKVFQWAEVILFE